MGGGHEHPGPSPQEQKARLQRLTAEALGTVHLPEEEVEVPGLGGTVLIKAFNSRTAAACRHWSIVCKHGKTLARTGNLDPDPWEREPCMGVLDAEEPEVACETGVLLDENMWERNLVLYGVVDPKLDTDTVTFLFDEQAAGVARVLALKVLALSPLNQAQAGGPAKDSGRTQS